MVSCECTLLSTGYITNSIGVQEETLTQKVIPIMKIEDIYANEFYQASSTGFKPELRIRTSSLNYNGEKELIYMGKTYSVIRTQNPTADETIIICERKLKNGKE